MILHVGNLHLINKQAEEETVAKRHFILSVCFYRQIKNDFRDIFASIPCEHTINEKHQMASWLVISAFCFSFRFMFVLFYFWIHHSIKFHRIQCINMMNNFKSSTWYFARNSQKLLIGVKSFSSSFF